jgi:KUP system potassium uptake protein
LPKNIIFVEVVHRKVPYVHDERYHVTIFQKDATKGAILGVAIAFGFMEEPNVERVLADLAQHQEIDLPADPRQWIVHVSVENLLAARGASRFARAKMALFGFLRHVSQPAYYYYGLGNEVQLSAEILPVKVR